MKTMSKEIRSAWENKCVKVGEREEGLLHIMKTLASEFYAKKMSAEEYIYAQTLGAPKSEQRQKFTDTFLHQFNWVQYNGDTKLTIVDFKECMDEPKENEPLIRAFHFVGGEETTQTPSKRVLVKNGEVAKKVTYKVHFESGYTKEVEMNDLDKDGKPIMETRNVIYKATPKTRFGYTKDVIKAFLDAMEILAE